MGPGRLTVREVEVTARFPVIRVRGGSAAVPGTIHYSQCWEDPRTVRQALTITPDDDVLMITSGGCNVLALALDRPRSITAVDQNPAQNHLLALKLAAVAGCGPGELSGFLGAQGAGDRWQVYQRLRPALPPAARAYWDGQPRAIREGPIHCGRFERYLAQFRRWVLPLVHSQATVRRFLALGTLAEQREFYDRVWNTWWWRTVVPLFFSRLVQARLARAPGAFRYAALPDVGRHYLGRARHALQEVPVGDNYFLEYLATGRYAAPQRMPPYLVPDHQEPLRAALPSVRAVTDTVQAVLARTPDGTYSKFYFSDIFDWCSAGEVAAILRETVRTARPGARICYYNNLVLREHPPALDGVLERDIGLERQLHWTDRSFVYRRLVVEYLTR